MPFDSPEFAPPVELTQAIVHAPDVPELYARRAEVLARLEYVTAAANDLRHWLAQALHELSRSRRHIPSVYAWEI